MSYERIAGVMRGNSPCTDCAERHTACHDKCPKYHDWKAEAEKVKQQRRSYMEERQQIYEESRRRSRWGTTHF